MEAYIVSFPIDENSNEEREVLLRNIPIGKINVGLYSKWYNEHILNNPPEPIDILIARFLYKEYGYVITKSEDITNVKEQLRNKYDKTITELFTEKILCK